MINSWEMSTVGHPLSDVCNFLTSFYLADNVKTHYDTSGFLPGRTSGLPQPDQILAWYRETAGWDPVPELTWGMSFSIFKLSGVLQGIAARYAARQASSEMARSHAATRGAMAEFAWKLAQEAGAGTSSKL